MIKYLIIGVLIMNSCSKEYPAPIANKKPYEMTIHDHTRIDDYYWMRLTDEQKSEEPYDNQTKEVIDYANLENNYTQMSLSHTKNLQEKLFNEMVGRIKKDDETVPYLQNGYYYYNKYQDDKEYAIYCRKKGTLDAKEEIILDANELSEGYDYFAVGRRVISPDNEWVAYSIDTVGRRQYSIYFKNLATQETLDYSIPNTETSIAWANDNKTIFYTGKNKVSLLSEKIYRHQIGSDFSNDVLVYEEKDTEYYIGVYRSKSGKFIIIYNQGNASSDFHILNANTPNGAFINFSDRVKGHEYSISHFGNKFYVMSNLNAPNNRLLEVNDDETKYDNWKEIIKHREKVHLLDMEVFSNHLVISEREEGLIGLRIINQKTNDSHFIDFGEDTYSSWISTNREFNTNILRYGYTSMVTPNSTYDYDMEKRQKVLLKKQEVVGGYNKEEYHAETLYASSRDGEKIPISVVYKKALRKSTPQNLLLYGYGAYGSTADPYFSSTRLSLLDRGFIFAIANVRGSQIYGRKSYDDGKLLNKKNTFYDFIDAGKFLIKENYTNTNHLYCYGGSAGGLLIGAVINMEPSMWNGAIAGVPFVDAITTMLDPTIPLTSNEWVEWGDPREKEYYDYILSYSPYDQILKCKYPNLLVTAGFFDSQVQYWEPLKWVAKLRDYWDGENKLYLHMNMDAGHGGKSGRFRRYKEYALEYAFLLDIAGIVE